MATTNGDADAEEEALLANARSLELYGTNAAIVISMNDGHRKMHRLDQRRE